MKFVFLYRCINIQTTKTKYKMMGKFGLTIISILLVIISMVIFTTLFAGCWILGNKDKMAQSEGVDLD